MMKRKKGLCLGFVAVIVVLAVCCTGCNNGEKAYKLYQSAVEKFNAANDLDMSMQYGTSVSFGENTSESSVNADMMAMDLAHNPTYLLYYDVASGDTSTTTEVYYADNTAYIASGNDRYKMEISPDALIEQYAGPILTVKDLKTFMSLSEDAFSKATITSEGGVTKVNVTLSDGNVKDIILETFRDVLSSGTSFRLDSEALSAADLNMTFSFNQEEYFTDMTLSTSVKMNMGNAASFYSRTATGGDEDDSDETDRSQGNRGNREDWGNRGDRNEGGGNRWQNGNMEISMDLTMHISFNNPGAPVEIIPPNGLSQYEERTANDRR